MANTKNPPMERGPKTDNAANKRSKSRELGGNNRGYKGGKLPGGKR